MPLIIPFPIPSLNQLINASKGHWSKYAQQKNAATVKVCVLARRARCRPVQGPIELSFAIYAPDRRTDPDNVAAGVHKAVLDGLVMAGVLPDDGWQWIAGWHDAFAVDKANPRVEVTWREA